MPRASSPRAHASRKERHAIGIDVGGTKTAGAIVGLASGRLTARRQAPTRPERGGEAVLRDVLEMSAGLTNEARRLGIDPEGLGLGVPELVDPAGRVFSGHRVAWSGVPVQERLSALMPARVEADVRAAALAEARLGAGRGIDHFLYVSVGTGVSAVLVQHGQPYAGSRGAALVIANGPQRRLCGACGHEESLILEDLASGPAIAAAVGVRTAEEALLRAGAGNGPAGRAVEHAARELGQTLALLAGSLDPAAVIVGGGLGSAPGAYFDALCRSLASGLWDADARTLPVRQAALGPDAGLIGAALGAARRMDIETREHETT